MLVDRRLDGKCIHTTQGVFSGEVSGDVEVSYVAYMERESKWKRISLFWKYAGSESTLCKIDFATCDRDQKSALTPYSRPVHIRLEAQLSFKPTLGKWCESKAHTGSRL
jgi:hypothetical protein